MKALDAIKNVLNKILEILGTVTLGIMTVLVVYQVITRYVFNAPSPFSEALSQYLFVWMIMFGSAYVYGSREHLTIDLLKDKFSPKLNMIVEVIANICLFFFFFLVCVYGGWKYTASQVNRIVITLYYAVYNCICSIRDYQQGKRETGDPLGGTA